jgi:hypothetical protein
LARNEGDEEKVRKKKEKKKKKKKVKKAKTESFRAIHASKSWSEGNRKI